MQKVVDQQFYKCLNLAKIRYYNEHRLLKYFAMYSICSNFLDLSVYQLQSKLNR